MAKQSKRRKTKAECVGCSAYWIEAVRRGHLVPSGRVYPRHLKRDWVVYPSRTCRCRACAGRRQWPNCGYVGTDGLSCECRDERQSVDPDLEEELEKLRGGRATVIDYYRVREAIRRGESY